MKGKKRDPLHGTKKVASAVLPQMQLQNFLVNLPMLGHVLRELEVQKASNHQVMSPTPATERSAGQRQLAKQKKICHPHLRRGLDKKEDPLPG